MKNHKLQNKKQSGFTILVAVITAGILIIIAMSIGGIALKEQTLTSANKEAQIAFYAADTGMECALYWDQKKGVFADKTTDSFNCNGAPVENLTVSPSDPEVFPYTFSFKFNTGTGEFSKDSCAVVKVTKKNSFADPKYSDQIGTLVESFGYNNCNSTLNRMERGIKTSYPMTEAEFNE